MMREIGGLRIILNRHLPAGTILVLRGEGAVAFRDKYDLVSAFYWLRMGPILDRLADEAAREWARIKQ